MFQEIVLMQNGIVEIARWEYLEVSEEKEFAARVHREAAEENGKSGGIRSPIVGAHPIAKVAKGWGTLKFIRFVALDGNPGAQAGVPVPQNAGWGGVVEWRFKLTCKKAVYPSREALRVKSRP